MEEQAKKRKDEEKALWEAFQKNYRAARKAEGLPEIEDEVFRSDVESPNYPDIVKTFMENQPAEYVRAIQGVQQGEVSYEDAVGELVTDYLRRNSPKVAESINRRFGGADDEEASKAWNQAKAKIMSKDPRYSWAAEDPQTLINAARAHGRALDEAGHSQDPVADLKALGIEVPAEFVEAPDSDSEY